MKRALTRAAAVLTLLLGAPLSPLMAAPITIDFDSLPGAVDFNSGTPITGAAQLASVTTSGVTVTFSSGSPFVGLVNLGAGHASSGTQGISGSTPGGLVDYSAANPITFSFFDAVTGLPIAVSDFSITGDQFPTSGGQPLTLLAFDINGNLIGSVTQPDSLPNILALNIGGIHRVQFIGFANAGGGDGIGLDDLKFNGPTQFDPTPEPTSIILLGATLLGGCLYARLRRNRKQQPAV